MGLWCLLIFIEVSLAAAAASAAATPGESLRYDEPKKRAGSSFADGFVSENGTTVLPTYRYGRIAFVSRPPRKPKQQRDARPFGSL